MARGLLWAFVLLPLIEIALFVIVGGWLSLWPTLALVVLAAVAGMAVLRRQGAVTAGRMRAAMAQGADPGGALAEGSLIMLAGVLLVLPGFLSDAVALMLLTPPLRRALIGWVGARVVTVNLGGFAARGAGMRGETIEGEWEEVDPSDTRHRPSGWTRPPLPDERGR